MFESLIATIQDFSTTTLILFFLVYLVSFLLGYIVILRQKISSTSASPKSGSADLPDKDQVLHLIKTRRSVMPKDLCGEVMSDSDVEYLLEAANWAPTHGKTEPWRYVAISGSQNMLDYLEFLEDWYLQNSENITDEEMNKFNMKCGNLKSQLLSNASHLLVICMKRQALPEKLMPEWEEICATACSVQNIHLALTALKGWGGFWSSHTWCKHARESKQFKEYLGLEEEDRVFGAFIIGKVTPGKTFKSTRNAWQTKVTWRTN